MKKYIAAITAAALSVCLLAACGGNNGNGGNTAQTSAASEAAVTTEASAATEAAQAAETAAPSGELKKFDVILDWYPNAVHTSCMKRRKTGILRRKEGLS